MPLSFSSCSRSVSFPVRAFMSVVFPWSMWPAVPRVSPPSVILSLPRRNRTTLWFPQMRHRQVGQQAHLTTRRRAPEGLPPPGSLRPAGRYLRSPGKPPAVQLDVGAGPVHPRRCARKSLRLRGREVPAGAGRPHPPWLPSQSRSAPQIIGDRYTQLSPQFGQVLHPYCLREAQHLEVGGVDTEEQGGPLRNSGLIVGYPRLVGGTHFHQVGSALAHYVRDAEGTPNLHQLSPGDYDLLSRGQLREQEQYCGGVVVDHHASFRAGETDQKGFNMFVS